MIHPVRLVVVIALSVALVAAGLVLGLVGIGLRNRRLVSAGAGTIRRIQTLWPSRGACFVYFISDSTDAVKVGISGHPQQRLASLRTAQSGDLELLGTVRCRSGADARRVEADLHHHFARQRLNGEWFDLDHRHLRTAVRLARRWR